MRTKLVAVLLFCGSAGLQAQRETSRVLRDYRVDGAQEPVRQGAMVDAETRQQVLHTLFPKSLNSPNACKPQSDPRPADSAWLDSQRKAGQFAPSIETFAEGAFTAPLRSQTVYFIRVGECSAETRTYWGTYQLALFEGAHLIARMDPQASGLAAMADIDNKGIDELLLENVNSGQGEIHIDARLVSLAEGKLGPIKTLERTYDNPCGRNAEMPVKASVITYAHGELSTRQYEAPCTASSGGMVPPIEAFRAVH
jgi:hypothetical protein